MMASRIHIWKRLGITYLMLATMMFSVMLVHAGNPHKDILPSVS